jgi:phosphonopyruvate decarboxylase
VLSPEAVFNSIRAQGVGFFSGVPDSLLKDFCAYVTDHAPGGDHVIAANEGNAVALAMGHYLASGRPALVYMQNSGIGNAVNPLTSLADPEVYGIPMLLMVGWRGAPGCKDEPQHVKQGRIMPEFIAALELPCFALDADISDVHAVIGEACKVMLERETPVVLLVSPDAFSAYKLKGQSGDGYPMNREDAIKRVVDGLDPDAVVIATTGKTSRELYEYRASRGAGHGKDFLTVGGMGHTSSIALGVALATPDRPVLCLDGDGSAIMHMGALAIIGQSPAHNLVHVVINNGAHDSVGGQPTVGFDIDLTAVARACGYREAISVSDPAALASELSRLQATPGPVMLEVRVNKGARADLGRPNSTPGENRRALMKYLAS